MTEKKGVIFNKKIFATGGSQAVIIPPELNNFLDITEGSEVELAGYQGKHGKFIAIWKKQEEVKQQ